MKHFMMPRNTILRENEAPPLPNPSPSKPRSSRKQKSSKENFPPLDPSFPSPATAATKLKSTLPPRLLSSNPLRRKLCMENTIDSSVSVASNSGVQDELRRVKGNDVHPVDSSEGHSAAWIRRSLDLINASLNCPISLRRVDEDGDEEMEIDEEAVEKLCIQVGEQSGSSEAPVCKVEVGVQTSHEMQQEPAEEFIRSSCKSRMQIEDNEVNDGSNLLLVPDDASKSADKLKKQVPKAVEKVLAGAIRREMVLEDLCAKQTSEIVQLKRLVQQFKHERECNSIIAQTREDQILRLQSLMDDILPTEDFMEEELVFLRHEHKLLKEKYENYPEVLRTKIELKSVQDELENLRNFHEMGEREVFLEEIRDLRSQLLYYIDSSSLSRKRNPSLQSTYSRDRTVAPSLVTISESNEESAEDKLAQERMCWTEAESNWISLSEELRSEIEALRSQAEKRERELENEKKCVEEFTKAIQLAMEGYARMLEQYVDLEEKHMALLGRHRRVQEGLEDVKKAAAKTVVRESKFINTLSAEALYSHVKHIHSTLINKIDNIF